jgi:hypothetical protein
MVGRVYGAIGPSNRAAGIRNPAAWDRAPVRHTMSAFCLGISATGENALDERELSSPKRIKLHLAQFAHQDCSLMGDLSGGLK